MTKYKVGDVAALFSKPKNPTTAGGEKLQSLFKDYYNKKSKPIFHSQKEENFEINESTENVKVDNPSVSKKNRKRKFSSTDSELNENVSSKKFKESSEQEEYSENIKNKKLKKHKKKHDFPRKHNELNENEIGSTSNTNEKWEPHRGSPKKNKKSNVKSLNTSEFEAENVFENATELSSAFKLQNVPKDIKQNKGFIKKSKKKSLDYDSSKLSNNVLSKDSDDEDDATLKNEIKKFMNKNSLSDKMESTNNNNFKQENSFHCKEQDGMKKAKQKYLGNVNSSPQKLKKMLKHDKNKNKKYNNQEDFPGFNKESKANSFNFANKKPGIERNSFEQDLLLKNPSPVEKQFKKQSKKKKRELNDTHADNSLMVDNNFETNAPKTNKVVDFKRKPKNKKGKEDALCADDLNPETFVGKKADEHFQYKKSNVNNMMEVKVSAVETGDFIKLPHSNEEISEKDFEERLSRTLFVGNLSKSISKTELKHLFSTFGVIESMRLTGIETDKAKIYGKNPPKLLHSNYASDTIPRFVVFRERQSAVEALKLSGSMFKGHHITVDFAVAAGTHKLYDDKRSIFIGNLPFDVKDESIWNAFTECGRIEGVRVVRDRSTGLGKGFGYVLFSTIGAKENAMALDGLRIEGREIRIKSVDSNKKTQKFNLAPAKRDTFKSRAIRQKKNKMMKSSGRKSIRKLTNKQKNLHQKKKISSVLQKAMK